MKKLLKWGLFTLILAVFFHIATVYAYPYGIMRIVGRLLEDRTGVGVNQPYHSTPITPLHRTVVMPSPDLLYSIIRYDLEDGPLRIFSEVPKNTYWSLSFYANNTDNYFHLNDREAKEEKVEIILVGPGAKLPEEKNIRVIMSPSVTGVILTRALIMDPGRMEKLITAQSTFICK